MGRTRTFDTDDAVRSARAVFWRQGYEGASLPDLEQATGLNRSSLYHAFGSKRGLFDAAVESYLDEIIRPRLRILTDDPVAPDAVQQYLTDLRSALLASASAASENGCLIVNTAGSPIAKDAAIRDSVLAYRQELEAALTHGLSAQPGTDAASVPATAKAITSLVVAAMTLTRVDSAAAAETLDSALALAAGQSSTSIGH